MVASVETRLSQAGVMVIADAAPAPVNISQAGLMVIANFPAAEARISQAGLMVIANPQGTTHPLRLSQLGLMVIASGRVADPIVRAWTFSMDEHDFYVVRLSDLETLVYDMTSGQWYQWGDGTDTTWRLIAGFNWLGAETEGMSYFMGSNVIAGDDEKGTIWFLDPLADLDEDPLGDPASKRTFSRSAFGQITLRGTDYAPCFGVQVIGDTGFQTNTDLQTGTLFTSDDGGVAFADQGSVVAAAGTYGERYEWRSLGSMRSPGRLFKFIDDGVFRRIDGFELMGDEKKPND